VLLNTGAAGIRAVDGIVVAIGHLRDRAETRRLGRPGPANDENLTVRRL
jgi:hypothetical protein